MAVINVAYKGKSENGPSPNLWADCPVLDVIVDPNVGYRFFDDFTGALAYAPGAAGAETTMIDNYEIFVGTDTAASSIAINASTVGGAIGIVTAAQDNQVGVITTGVPAFLISDTAGSEKKLWFEARFKLDTITDDHSIAFIGLTEEGLAASEELLLTDAGALASKDAIGFLRPEGDGDTIDCVYRKASQNMQTSIDAAHTLVADTYVKMGFVYDPTDVASKRIKWFVNNTEQSTYVTATNIAAATFPDGEELCLTAGIKAAEAGAHTLTIDWWQCVQLR